MQSKINLIGLSLDEMTAAFASLGLQKFRAKQVWQWLYLHGKRDLAEMTNIPNKAKDIIAENFNIARPEISKDLLSKDGTRKWLLKFADGNEAESVYIPEENRGTLCISSQVGCTLSCTFCHTGTQVLVRNLTAGEIIEQVLIARDGLGEWGTKDNKRHITSIVLMGMGEPLYNYDEVAKALKILMDSSGIAFSKRKITLSTSGHVPNIKKTGDELGVNLAISLHAVTDKLRDEIVPLNRKYPIAELIQTCKDYSAANNTRRITFEYVMLKGINDSDKEAHQLVKLLQGVDAKVNLIPFNPWHGSNYECSSNNRIHSFKRIIFDAGISAPVRKTRGQDIYAACGQLKSASEREQKSRVKL